MNSNTWTNLFADKIWYKRNNVRSLLEREIEIVEPKIDQLKK